MVAYFSKNAMNFLLSSFMIAAMLTVDKQFTKAEPTIPQQLPSDKSFLRAIAPETFKYKSQYYRVEEYEEGVLDVLKADYRCTRKGPPSDDNVILVNPDSPEARAIEAFEERLTKANLPKPTPCGEFRPPFPDFISPD